MTVNEFYMIVSEDSLLKVCPSKVVGENTEDLRVL